MRPDPMVRLTTPAGARADMRLSEFFRLNADGIDAAEQALIRQALADGTVFQGGGGAFATWTLEALELATQPEPERNAA